MKKNIQKIQQVKNEGKKITVLTAYDYSTAKYFDEAGIDIVLIGDSLAQVILGLNSTSDISMTEMQVFTSAVSRGVKDALVVADMPFMSSQIDKSTTAQNALLLIKAGANAVKIEGASDFTLDCIKHLTQNGIPVMGHLGFTPLSINALGGNKIQGKDANKTLIILEEAKKLQDAGCFAIVLELMPSESASFITENLEIPTIGIGAGANCSGQVLVSEDMLGKYDRFTPKFARKYANLKDEILSAAKKYIKDVEEGVFPSKDESFALDIEEIKKLESYK
ncbi:3-methyl-2-oxobutanoate hydroxymethyltransferase [bacterium]|nr:3-methyl-2-oxobutanoate hydroxymethyltransferase [bacterium]